MSIVTKGIDFSDMSGGKNSVYPKHAIAENQVAQTLNAIHEKIGISRAPGYVGITPLYEDDAIVIDSETESIVIDSVTESIVVTKGAENV
jgi:hypothetical protein